MGLDFLCKWGKAKGTPGYRAGAKFLASSRPPESESALVGLCGFMFTMVPSSLSPLKHAACIAEPGRDHESKLNVKDSLCPESTISSAFVDPSLVEPEGCYL